MDKRTATYQWAQLLVLSLVHFTVDVLGNTLPSILPRVREEFAMSLSLGTLVVVALTITANGVQMFTGGLRAKKTTPFFLHLGMVLAISICMLASLPRVPFGVVIMVLLAVIAGFGVGSAHPEGLRGVHTLSRIPAAISTAVFMTGGFLGFCMWGRNLDVSGIALGAAGPVSAYACADSRYLDGRPAQNPPGCGIARV